MTMSQKILSGKNMSQTIAWTFFRLVSLTRTEDDVVAIISISGAGDTEAGIISISETGKTKATGALELASDSDEVPCASVHWEARDANLQFTGWTTGSLI